MIKITDVAKKGFIGEIRFIYDHADFGIVDVREPLHDDISYYVFLFKIMEDSFKDQPELKMKKFAEIFETSYEIVGKEKTEEEIERLFGKSFTISISDRFL